MRPPLRHARMHAHAGGRSVVRFAPFGVVSGVFRQNRPVYPVPVETSLNLPGSGQISWFPVFSDKTGRIWPFHGVLAGSSGSGRISNAPGGHGL